MTIQLTETTEPVSPFLQAQGRLEAIAKLIGLDTSSLDLLRQNKRELRVVFPVRMDDGTTKTFVGFRIVHGDALGPAKGGIRFHPTLDLDMVRALAMEMTWKCALSGLPLGGGKGGVQCDPRALSKQELERVSRGYMGAIHRLVGPGTDIPAPDVYTTPQIMGWMMDEYELLSGMRSPPLLESLFAWAELKAGKMPPGEGRLSPSGRCCAPETCR